MNRTTSNGECERTIDNIYAYECVYLCVPYIIQIEIGKCADNFISLDNELSELQNFVQTPPRTLWPSVASTSTPAAYVDKCTCESCQHFLPCVLVPQSATPSLRSSALNVTQTTIPLLNGRYVDAADSSRNILPGTGTLAPTRVQIPTANALNCQTALVRNATYKYDTCWLCGFKDNLISTPIPLRGNLYAQRGVWIESLAMMCPKHIVRDKLRVGSMAMVVNVPTTLKMIPEADVRALIQGVEHYKHSGLNFDDHSLTDTDYKRLTGITKADFDDVMQHIHLVHRGGPVSPQTSLGLFLMKLRTGLSHTELSTVFRVHMKTVYRTVRSVREALMRKGGFVELNLGVHSHSRDTLISDHTSQLAKSLFGPDKLILIEDGTYLYIQKSFNNRQARRTYCVHKKRHLVKPMVCVTTTGRFVDIFGPYFSDSKNSDAKIFTHQMCEKKRRNAKELRGLMQRGDLWIVDRGFQGATGGRAVLKMPAFKKHRATQLETAASNHSRKITKLRWVVEAANGRLKQFKFLARVISNNQLPFVGDYCRIVAAVCNKYRRPLAQDKPHHREMAEKMLERESCNNDLQEKCTKGGIHASKSKQHWNQVEQIDRLNFPMMTNTELERYITFGCYQIEQAENYMFEHLSTRENLEVYQSKSDPHVIRTRLQSRHQNRTEYDVYVELDPKKNCPWDKLKSWYCDCTCGTRTLGCCSHVISVVWWLGVGRLEGVSPRKNNWLSIINAPEVEAFDDEDSNWSDVSNGDSDESVCSASDETGDNDDSDRDDGEGNVTQVDAVISQSQRSVFLNNSNPQLFRSRTRLSTVEVLLELPIRAPTNLVPTKPNQADVVGTGAAEEDEETEDEAAKVQIHSPSVLRQQFVDIGLNVQFTTSLT
jgi:hypothetical protein